MAAGVSFYSDWSSLELSNLLGFPKEIFSLLGFESPSDFQPLVTLASNALNFMHPSAQRNGLTTLSLNYFRLYLGKNQAKRKNQALFL